MKIINIIDNEIIGMVACMGKGEVCIKLYDKLGFKVTYIIPYFPRIYFRMKYTKEENNTFTA
jgi:hypothetical protein